MALPRLDYQRPDYAGQIGQGLSALSKEVEANSPAPEIVQKYLRMAMSGKMSPQEAARRAQAEHHLNSQPTQASQSAPQSPGPWREGLGAGPAPSGSFTGPREFSDTETVMGSYPPASSASQLEDLPEENLPIRNKDVPMLIQVGGMSNKGQSNDVAMLNYLERQRQFGLMEPHRAIRDEATQATMANIPFKNSMQERHAGMRQRGLDISAARLGEQQTEQYMRAAGPSLEMSNALGQLLNEGRQIPGIRAPDDYARARRAADIYEKMPFLGQMTAEFMRNKAAENLTPAQREWQRRLTQSMADYVHGKYGANLTSHELRLAQTIAGDQYGYEDTLAALEALKQSVESHSGLAGQAWPGAAQRIGKPQLPAMPPPQQLPGRQRLSAKQYGAQSLADIEMLRRNSPNVDWIDDIGGGSVTSEDLQNIDQMPQGYR